MIHGPSREREYVSWLLVIAWVIFIFATIPVARRIRAVVSALWGRQFFTYVTLVAIVLAAGVCIWHLYRRSAPSLGQLAWLSLTATVYIGGTIHLRQAPEEAFHFVQYGVLGVLSYRALTHRVRDPSVYLSAALIGGIVGFLDEAIQWVTPGRYWGLRDIWIDLLGAAVAQVGIAKGLQPTIIREPLGPVGIRWLCRLGIALSLVAAVTLLNTPQRIAWYSSKIPILGFLKTNESVMFEYGYYYDDPETGPFKSRFPEQELRRIDSERGKQVGELLGQFQDESTYPQFLAIYTPVGDPFAHEARVHLFRRDRNLRLADESDRDENQRRVHLTVAYRENRILERYFSNTLLHSDCSLGPEELTELREGLLPENQLPRKEVVSGVSKHLVTPVRESQILILLLIVLMSLVTTDLLAGLRATTRIKKREW